MSIISKQRVALADARLSTRHSSVTKGLCASRAHPARVPLQPDAPYVGGRPSIIHLDMTLSVATIGALLTRHCGRRAAAAHRSLRRRDAAASSFSSDSHLLANINYYNQAGNKGRWAGCSAGSAFVEKLKACSVKNADTKGQPLPPKKLKINNLV